MFFEFENERCLDGPYMSGQLIYSCALDPIDHAARELWAARAEVKELEDQLAGLDHRATLGQELLEKKRAEVRKLMDQLAARQE